MGGMGGMGMDDMPDMGDDEDDEDPGSDDEEGSPMAAEHKHESKTSNNEQGDQKNSTAATKPVEQESTNKQ